MNGYQKRRLYLEWQEWRLKVYNLERSLDNCDAAINQIRGPLRSVDIALNLGYAARSRSIVATQLAEARAREQALARQLEGPRDRWADDQREHEETGLAALAAMDKMVSGR